MCTVRLRDGMSLMPPIVTSVPPASWINVFQLASAIDDACAPKIPGRNHESRCKRGLSVAGLIVSAVASVNSSLLADATESCFGRALFE